MPMFARIAMAVAALHLIAGASGAQAKDDRPGQSNLETLKTQFLVEKQKAQEVVIQKFDALIARASNKAGLKAAERVCLAQRWTADRDRFRASEQIPADSDLAPLGVQYAKRVSDKYRPVSKAYDAAIQAALNSKDANGAADLQKA